MASDLGVFTGEAVDFVLGERSTKAGVEFARELDGGSAFRACKLKENAYVVVEFGEKFSVEEEVGRCGKLVCNGIEEDFGAVVLVLLVGALLGFHGQETHAQDVSSIAEKNSFAACVALDNVGGCIDGELTLGE